MSLPSGHSATLLLRVGDTGFDFSALADLCYTTHQNGETTADCTPTLALSLAKHFNLWRQKQKRLAFLSLYCSRYNIYMYVFFLCCTLKSSISPLFSKFVLLLLQKVLPLVFLHLSVQCLLFRFLSSLSC